MSIYVAKPGQSIYDVCMQVYGTLDQLYKLIQDNSLSGVGVESDALLGKNLVYDPSLTVNPAVFNNAYNQRTVYATNNPTTKITTSDAILNDSGINILDDSGNQILMD